MPTRSTRRRRAAPRSFTTTSRSIEIPANNMTKLTCALTALVLGASSLALIAGDNPKGDWPMWGGTPDRNMHSSMKGIPTAWDVKGKKNVKWVTELGSQTYGNPVVANGVVYVGTNNET